MPVNLLFIFYMDQSKHLKCDLFPQNLDKVTRTVKEIQPNKHLTNQEKTKEIPGEILIFPGEKIEQFRQVIYHLKA